MIHRTVIAPALAGLFLLTCLTAEACCPTGPRGKPVVNADQTVIIIWDPVAKMQHFIRQASFKSDADDFGFLVPSPNQPELQESGNEAFEVLRELTEPEIKYVYVKHDREPKKNDKKSEIKVRVLEEKMIAGFHAAVLETRSTASLVKWLKDNGYPFSPEVEAWARPYVEAGWKITALKVAKDKEARDNRSLKAAALRMSFATERPLFPYREPDYKSVADKLGAMRRLLRIYFISDGRYQGQLTPAVRWTGQVAWAGKVSKVDRKTVLEHLNLPQSAGPADWYLTEFEDNWPYQVAPADVYFSQDANQNDVRRNPITITITRDSYEPSSTGLSPVVVAGIFVAVLVALVLVFVGYRMAVIRNRQQADSGGESSGDRT